MCIHAPRKIAHLLLSKVRQEIDRMLNEGVISPVTEPTSWCSGIVVVPKQNGSIRFCGDLTQLNKSVQREIHPMALVDESLAKLADSKISKLDARSGFWQIPLAEESKHYTTFITPFGRYCFNRLPFGISSASDIFQRTISKILGDMDGVIAHMDDILVHAKDQASHDQRLREAMKRLQEAGLTLNEKCEFSKDSIRFLGHIIDSSGIRPDPAKLDAINRFPPPTNITELQRFLGMANQQAKFMPNLASVTAPLCSLPRKDSEWMWTNQQEMAFQQVKNLLLSPPVLAHYSTERETFLATDASNAGLGAVLFQTQDDKSRRPVCYISRSLTDTERNYAVIEKEALAVTWACERLSEYLLGLSFTVETDHKPLVPLMTTTEVAKMPPRIQRFRIRLMRFSPNVIHVPWKNQISADTLSRVPLSGPEKADISLVKEAELLTKQAIDSLPASKNKLHEIKELQKSDPETAEIREYCTNGWPTYMPESPLIKQYWTDREHLTIVDDLLLFDSRIVIPRQMRLEMLKRIHEGHLGIVKCRALASFSVWWPHISKDIEDLVQKCDTCAKHRPTQKEPLLPSSFPERPWARLGMDLFELHGKTFFVVVDYYS